MDKTILTTAFKSLFYPCPQVPTLVIESDEEKEEPAPESTFVPVEPASMYILYIIVLYEYRFYKHGIYL